MFVLRPRSRTATTGPRSPTSYGALADTCETKSWASQAGTARAHATAASGSTSPGSRDDPAQGPAGAQMPCQRPRVEAGDGRHAARPQQVDDLAGPSEHAGRGMADDEAAQPGPLRLVVIGCAPVVADEREGHDHHLAGVAGVGADLLVAGLRGVDDEVAAAAHLGAEGDAREGRAVLERQQAWTAAADARVDHGIGREGQGGPARTGRPTTPVQSASPVRTRSIPGPMTSTQPAYCLAEGEGPSPMTRLASSVTRS